MIILDIASGIVLGGILLFALAVILLIAVGD